MNKILTANETVRVVLYICCKHVLEYTKQLEVAETHVLWCSSGNRFGNSWVQKYFIPLLTIYKVMDKLNTNIEQSSRYCMHSFWMRNIVLGFTELSYVELAISTTVNVSTGQMIFILVNGAEAKLTIDLAIGTSRNIPS